MGRFLPPQLRYEEAVKEGKQLAAELEAGRLAAPPELMKALEEFARSPEALKLHEGDYQVDHRGRVIRPKDDGQTLGLKDAERPHPWATAIVEACKAQGQKAFAMPSGSIPLAPVSTVPISMGQLGAPLIAAIGLRRRSRFRAAARMPAAAGWASEVASSDAPDGTSRGSKRPQGHPRPGHSEGRLRAGRLGAAGAHWRPCPAGQSGLWRNAMGGTAACQRRVATPLPERDRGSLSGGGGIRTHGRGCTPSPVFKTMDRGAGISGVCGGLWRSG